MHSASCGPDVCSEWHSASSHPIRLQAVMLSHTTWPFCAFLERHWRRLHNYIKIFLNEMMAAVDRIKLAQNRKQYLVLIRILVIIQFVYIKCEDVCD
jgi:hypothetical protein